MTATSSHLSDVASITIFRLAADASYSLRVLRMLSLNAHTSRSNILQSSASSFEEPANAPDFLHKHEKRIGSGGPYWYSQIKRQGKVAYGFNSSYVIWRNVKDYGAMGEPLAEDEFEVVGINRL